MASLRFTLSPDGACEVDVELLPHDRLPLHWDLTWREKFRVCWFILCGRAFTMSGPMRFKLNAPPGSRVSG